MSWPKTMLMVSPDYFDVEYSINPHMLDANGQLNQVNKLLAKEQWFKLKDTFEKTGMQVHVIDGAQGLPDMVFCANQTFPFYKEGQKSFILSKMQSNKRQPEVSHFNDWANKNDIKTYEIQSQLFEGMGDALWNYETEQLFVGYGFRTQVQTLQELENITGKKVLSFELKDDRFYHLDTCLSLLNATTAAYVPEAFTEEGIQTLKAHIPHLLTVPLEEATKNLACNMCTPNGLDVILQKGSHQTVEKLKEHKFNVIEVETSEFIKSGGSVFCMKQLLF